MPGPSAISFLRPRICISVFARTFMILIGRVQFSLNFCAYRFGTAQANPAKTSLRPVIECSAKVGFFTAIPRHSREMNFTLTVLICSTLYADPGKYGLLLLRLLHTPH